MPYSFIKAAIDPLSNTQRSIYLNSENLFFNNKGGLAPILADRNKGTFPSHDTKVYLWTHFENQHANFTYIIDFELEFEYTIDESDTPIPSWDPSSSPHPPLSLAAADSSMGPPPSKPAHARILHDQQGHIPFHHQRKPERPPYFSFKAPLVEHLACPT